MSSPEEVPEGLGILGGGQLGRMLVEPANRHNIRTNILDKEDAPAKKISAGKHIDGDYKDKDKIMALAKTVKVLTVEIEHVDTYALEEAAKSTSVKVEPHWMTLRIIQNKFLQKKHLQKYSVAVAEYEEVKERNSAGLAAIGDKLGYPFMLKSQKEAYDGKGNYPVRSAEDIDAALAALGSRDLYAEKWAEFKAELAVMVVKTKDDVLSFPTVETVHEDSVCKLVYAPARIVSTTINEQAQALARKAVAAFEGKGVFGVEMFLLKDDTLLINEIAPRPHNSGHYTIEACPMSQYEAHLRAILDMPIPKKSLRLKEPAVMLNILGGATPDTPKQVADAACEVANASIHLYEKGDSTPGRKMGHITVTAPSMAECEATIAPLIELTNKLRLERTDIGAPHSQAVPKSKRVALVGVIMGSDSDLPVLQPGLELLENTFGIEVDVDITSAHRTPLRMDEYASKAASRGIKVIIAAAGGAAHLPGMAASHTTLPVVGVPVKGKVFDGQDSLLSMVQMPPGVPLGVMGVNNSKNAALYAVRILAAFDDDLKQKYEKYVDDMKVEVENKAEKLKEGGWAKYLSERK
jgi:phosphoribosylaminoimidazole carboxylase